MQDFYRRAEFILSAAAVRHMPPDHGAEVAIAGRSNVGKSTFINVLTGIRKLARTSKTPGRTQLINFFLINKTFSFVDLPGYGYAKVPASVRKKWGPMIETYLSTRKTLKGVALIMDIRRFPSIQELNFIEWLYYYNIPGILILTKADKLSKTKQLTQQAIIGKALSVDKDDLILFSAKSRLGKDVVWDAIEELIGY